MTRPGLRHCTVCAHVGPRVGAVCTRLSLDSVHCSESHFGTLLMNTIHDHYSQGFKKNLNKLNKIIFFKNKIKKFLKYDLIYELIVLHYL